MALVADYGGDDSDEGNALGEESVGVMLSTPTIRLPHIDLTPAVPDNKFHEEKRQIDLSSKEIMHNPTYEELFAPVHGADNPFKSADQKARKNTLTGFVEAAHINKFQFENEHKTYQTYGYAKDPSADANTSRQVKVIGNLAAAKQTDAATVFEGKKTGGEKRKRVRNMDSADVEGYTGPWGKFVDEETVSKPSPELQKVMDALVKKRKKSKRVTKSTENFEEKSVLHIDPKADYQGRNFMQPPQDVGVNLRSTEPPERCFIPKKQIHTWAGHNKGVQCIRWFPQTAHMLLSASMDTKIKLWEVYKNRRCIRTYAGHKMAVRDVTYNNDGSEFLSASFDRYVKVWDTETGACKQRMTTGKVPFCVKYNPDPDKQHFFLSGMQDKKVIQWDLRSGEQVQEYDRHLGAVNTITFFDFNRRFCTTSDDKSLRIWEWEIPVDTKLIQDSGLHSMPFVAVSPNLKWMVGQAMDNRIMLFQMMEEKLRFAKKKPFKGHMTAGYACGVDFSPDMTYLCSGDADGRVFVWDWKLHKLVAKWKAHDNVCIGVLWHPHETSKMATCGWDGAIKFWD